MRIAHIDAEGVVVNLVFGGAEIPPPPGLTAVASDAAAIGDRWDGTSFHAPAPPPPTRDDVNAVRDARTAAGFGFGGKVISGDDASKLRISGAAQMAFMAIAGGAQPGDLRWHGGDSDFGWIARDNSVLRLDAPSMVAMGKAAAAWEQAHIFAARALKDLSPIPADYDNDARWPARAV